MVYRNIWSFAGSRSFEHLALVCSCRRLVVVLSSKSCPPLGPRFKQSVQRRRHDGPALHYVISPPLLPLDDELCAAAHAVDHRRPGSIAGALLQIRGLRESKMRLESSRSCSPLLTTRPPSACRSWSTPSRAWRTLTRSWPRRRASW